jgi:hypothetical protein
MMQASVVVSNTGEKTWEQSCIEDAPNSSLGEL